MRGTRDSAWNTACCGLSEIAAEMRLLHTTSYELKTFRGDVPPYAILSHTWGDAEIEYSDVVRKTGREQHPGWDKVAKCCRRAAADGWEYVWIDTCCIDKNDNTELGEAINSMFRWYAEAQICIAYLADVPPKYTLNGKVGDFRSPWVQHFRSSRWFTRGWTLQEMLAPSHLLFLDMQWGTIGSREIWESEVYEATGIAPEHQRDFSSTCLATKLSWAANRQTTREEDRAYSLLGLLGVHMPLIYGEGKQAFIRLQLELIRTSSDESIFAWTRRHVDIGAAHGILAPSPEFFQSLESLCTFTGDPFRKGFTMNNIGLSLRANVWEIHEENSRTLAIMLNCAAIPWVQSSKISPAIMTLKPYGEETDVFECTGIEFHADRTRSLSSLGVQDIIIRNNSGIEVESPRSHRTTEVTFKFPREIRLDMPRLVYFLPFYPRDSLTQRRGRVEYSTTVPSKFLIEDNKVRLKQAAAFIVPFTIPREEGSPLHKDCEFAIIVKAAAPRPKIGIWRWNERKYGRQPWQSALRRLTGRVNWNRERQYPTCARTSLDEVVRISIRYSASTDTLDHLEAVLDITMESNDAEYYVQDEREYSLAQSADLSTRDQPLVAPMPTVAPLRVKSSDPVEVPPADESSDTNIYNQKADPFEDLLAEFNDMLKPPRTRRRVTQTYKPG